MYVYCMINVMLLGYRLVLSPYMLEDVFMHVFEWFGLSLEVLGGWRNVCGLGSTLLEDPGSAAEAMFDR